MSTMRAPPVAVSVAVAQQAADWLTVLMSDEASEAQRADWLRWRAADAEHERAWQHIEAMSRRFGGLHGGAATQALKQLDRSDKPAGGRRRQLLLWLGVTGGAGLLAAHAGLTPWDGARAVLADYRTATGERRELALSDGSRVSLNTASAVNVRFDGGQRLLELLAGEIMVSSGHGAGSSAPLLVATHQGVVRALGTRFAVRQQDGSSVVSVFESAVEIRPQQGEGGVLYLAAGHSATFSRRSHGAPQRLGGHADAWARGQLIVDDVTLGQFLAELARYRPGVIDCMPAVAHLRLSGVFPLADTDRILHMLPNSLPVQVRSRTRWWVTVEPAAEPG
ncbi:FecR domain-containing protein [Janthinobacterium aquaticum]|uniref:FecR domain-containing protein n=1 Tax=Janthinobacterium sp. FT58W TaxID=2654254 RepID=UPI001D02B134|nr:FecR domain-containing protein [Janthinobacterium sp. FT58W]